MIQNHSQGIVFKVFVQPRSSINTITGFYGDAIKIKLTAPPVDGAANKMCLKFLAKRLMVSKSSLEIISGHTGRIKQVLLKGKNPNITSQVREHLKRLIETNLG